MDTENKPRPKGPSIDPDEIADIVRYARLGYLRSSVAELVGVSAPTVSRYWPKTPYPRATRGKIH